MRGLGVLGGSFDPIHDAHVAIALAAWRELRLERVLLLPAARSPHKSEPTVADPQARCAMIELAIQSHPQLQLDRRELNSSQPSFSYRTLEQLAVEFKTRLWLILGEDSFRSLDRWAKPERIAELAALAVARRGAAAGERPTRWRGAELHWLQCEWLAYDATQIRAQLARGEPVHGLPAAVESYIRQHRLYGAAAAPR